MHAIGRMVHCQIPRRMPSSRRLLAIACVAGAGVAVSGCAGAGGDRPASVLDRAAATDSSLGVRYVFHDRYSDATTTTRGRGYGQEEADQRRSREVAIDAGRRGEIIIDGYDRYTGGDLAVAELLGSHSSNIRWTKLDGSKLLDAGYIDELCSPELPAKIAGVLARSDPTIQPLGAARLHGIRTQRYRVTTTYGKILDVLAGDHDASPCGAHDRAAALTAELWIDRGNLVRRVRLRYHLTDSSTVETRDITGYDRGVRVTVPEGPTVGDVTDVVLRLGRSAEADCKASNDC